ncbi:MAG: hypothetical protein CL920_29765 [Deltaproteobacteria bacterium]|nr:hypothetical protein [Deltaproteobacteria bacterium]MBU52900.1 hypothetical protein [Deltaproteobacteria bacterium]
MFPIKMAGEARGFLRENTWDDRALDIKVTEVVEATTIDAAFLREIDERNHSLGTKLCCCRWDADDVDAKRAFFEAGYQLVESSVDFELPLRRFKGRKAFDFVAPQKEHHDTLVQIATEQFQFSRFHEDPKIPREKAARRYAYWMRDLLAQDKCRIALDKHDKIVGFFVATQEGENQRSLLVGLHPDFARMGSFFYSSVFESLKPKGGKVFGRVSTANIPAMKIHIQAGFTIRESSFDYHKHY